jgi:glycosyltransferase involved in cell wall biosynthesis
LPATLVSGPAAETPIVAFVLKGYPRLSETFIAQEILALEQRGLGIHIFSLRQPTDHAVHPIHQDIRAPVTYLPEYLHHELLRVLSAWWGVRRRPGYRNARSVWMRDLRRDPTRNRFRRFAQALVLAAERPESVGQLHAHFLHTPASVTRYASLLTQIPWSVSAHAKDIWTTPEWELREKLDSSRWTVTCTDSNYRYLASLCSAPEKVERLYHGLDFNRFPAPPWGERSPDSQPIVLSVGRAVAKKGYDVLLKALARLPTNQPWRLCHVGGGPLLGELRDLATRLDIAGRIEWLGPLPQQEVLACYRRADLFVLPSRVAADGDRDGLPNVLMEAQSQGVACVSTRVSGIPELILDGQTGLLVDADDYGALARAIGDLLIDPIRRRHLGKAGYERVRGHFSQSRGAARLSELFGALPVTGS